MAESLPVLLFYIGTTSALCAISVWICNRLEKMEEE